jgi:hypothetical protein
MASPNPPNPKAAPGFRPNLAKTRQTPVSKSVKPKNMGTPPLNTSRAMPPSTKSSATAMRPTGKQKALAATPLIGVATPPAQMFPGVQIPQTLKGKGKK